MGQAYKETGSGSRTFYGIIDGDIVNRVQEGTEGAEPRVLTKGANEGSTVWEVHNDAIPGMITGGGIVVKEFGNKKVPEIQINLDDDAMLQVPMTLLKEVAEVLPNLDDTKPVKIRSYKNKKGRIRLEFHQDGKKLESNFTVWTEEDGKWSAESINGLPEPTHDEIDGWDFRDHDKFLKGVVIEFFSKYDCADQALEAARFKEQPETDIPF